MNFKFSPGQSVEFSPVGGVAGRYNVVRSMPLEPHQDEPKYRIRGELAGEERVVSECSLNENVGSPHDYELAARTRDALRARK
jgi:hypothetical protein